MFDWAASLGPSGRFIGFLVALLYFGLLNSRLGGGKTLGKRLFRIRVTNRSGQTLSPMRSGLRFLVLGIPYFLNGVFFNIDPTSLGLIEYLVGALLTFLIFGGFGAIIYLFVFNRRTRQSLHDLAVGSFVVRDPSQTVPANLATPRLQHLIVVGCWLLLFAIGPSVVWVLWDSSLATSLQPLGGIQAAVEAQHNVQYVQVTVGQTTTSTVRTGTSTITFLSVQAQAVSVREDFDLLSSAIARTVLELHPELFGKQLLIVTIRHGFDLGIAAWSKNYRVALDAASWQKKLSLPRAELK